MINSFLSLIELQEISHTIILLFTIIIATVIVQKIVLKIISKSFKKSSKYLKVDETNFLFFKHVISAIIYLIGIGLIIYSIPSFRELSISLFAGAGILAIVVGFASQQALSNIVSGIFITIFKPFRIGDRITIGTNLTGNVEDINLRHTVIKNFENKRIIVPNSVISNETIENASISDEKICRHVEFQISYDSDLNKAMKIMQKQALKHPLHIDNRDKKEKEENVPEVKVRVIGFADSGVKLKAWVWAENPPDAFVMGCDLNKSIKEEFDKQGIEIPYPYRTIVYKKDMKKKK